MKRFLALSLVLTVILLACTLTACSLFGGNDTTSPCKNGHTWEDHEDLGEATCTMSGSVFKKCSVCGIKQEFTTPPIGHQLKDKNVYVAPTCTEEGYKGTAICTRSGCDYVDNLEIIPTVDHKYGKWTSVGDGTHKKVCSYDSNHVLIEECSGGTATCSSQATCKICGGKYGELGTEHKFNKEIATEEYLNTEATCIELATYFYSCECGEIGDETFEYGDLADHDYVDGSCSVCGEADPTVSISLEGTYTATDDWNNSFAVVVTADTITFTPPMSNEVVVTYTYENGIVTLYADGSVITNPAAMSLTITDGALVGMMYNGNTYTITVGGGSGEEPEDPEVLPGTFVVVDNMGGGALSGTYGYTIDEYNAVIVTKDGQYCSDFIFSIDMGGYWMVQIGSPSTNYLVNASYENVTVLAGELSVMTPGGAAYVFTFPASEGGEEEPEEGGNGTEENPYVVDDMPASITFESDTINKVYYIFTASQTGAITFTWPNADSWYGITELDANGDNTANSTSGYETTSFSFNVTEGTKYRVELGTWMIDGEVTITVTYGEAGGEEEPTVLSAPVVTVDENGLASWEAVENASGYIYVINDGEEQTTTELSVQLEDGQSIKVKAVGNATEYTDSAYSEVVTYTAPTEPEVITTIAGALAGSEGASVSLSGTVSGIYEAWNTQFNNMAYYLTDGTNTILVFRAGGDQVNIGDEVSVVGNVTDYNGTNQVAQGGTTTLVNAHVCSTFTEADCYTAAVCTVCGKPDGEALGHTDEEDNNGVCDRCGTDMESAANEVTVTAVYTGTTTTNMTGDNDAALIGLDATIFNVVSTKLGNNHVGLNKDGTIRLYAGTTGCDMTISVVDGYKIVSVKVTLAASNGGTIVVTDGTNTITATDNIYAIDGSTTVLTTSGTTQVRIASIEIVYTTASGSQEPEDPEQPEVCEHTGGTATCTDKAVCTKCGESYGEIDANAHSWNEGVVTTDPTCTTKGVKTYTCTHNAEHTKTEDVAIDKNAHTQDAIWAKDADSHRHYYPCCNADIVEDTAHTWTNGVCSVEGCGYICAHEGGTATCIAKAKCTVCGESYGELNLENHAGTEEWTYTDTTHTKIYSCCDKVVVEEENHEYVDGTCECGKAEPVPGVCEHTGGTATCTDKAVCTKCGESYGEIDANAHAWNEGVVTTDPTCTTKGVKTYTCTHNAEHIKTEDVAIDENAHSWNEGVVTTNPTCTTKGVKTYTCTHNAEHTKTEDVAIDENAHTWDEGEVTKEATCSATGTKIYTCTHNAEHTKTEELPVDENAHAWNEGEVTKEATCTQAGEMTFTCTYDSTHIKKTETEKADHNYDDGVCTNCPAISKNVVVATFEFGANGSAAHADGSEKTTYSETNNGYTFSFSGASKVYSGARDQMGNSALKLGTTSDVGTFTFEVPNDVTTVIINVAKYKANTTKITVNGTNYTLTKNSNNGEYDKIVVDTTSTKTVSFTTVSGGARCMIDSIQFGNKVECEHENAVAGEVVAPTCTEQGYTVYTCTCGEYKWDFVDATGHDMQAVEAKEANCVDTGIMAHYVCNTCGIKSVDELASETIESVELPINEDNHKSLEVLEAVEFTCTTDGKTEGQWCTACEEITIAQEIVYAHHVDIEPVDQKCDVCNATMCEHTETVWVSIDDNQHVKKCNSCGEVVTTENHEYEVLKVNAPTCTEDGFTEYKCTVCEHEKDDDYVDATGHTIAYKNNDGSTHDTYCTVCNYDIATGVAHVDNGTGSCDCGKAIQEESVEYTYQFTSKQYSANEKKALGSENWILAGDGGYWGYDGTKGQQFGSKGNPYKTLTLTSEKSFNKVSYIHINTSGAESIAGTLKVYVGDTVVETITLETTANDYNINIKNLNGAVKFEYTQTSSKAIYIKSIAVTYVA